MARTATARNTRSAIRPRAADRIQSGSRVHRSASRNASLTERLEPRSLLSATFSGIVYDDIQADGRTPTDPPLGGQTVELQGGSDPTAAPRTAVTGPDGRYAFTEVPDGSYNLRLVPTPGRYTTVPYYNEGYQAFSPSGVATDAYDFGSAAFASIAGTAFVDADRDGTRDPDEAPAAGQTVFIDYDYDRRRGTFEPAATTGADGAYRFDEMRSGGGAHRVSLQPPAGWVRTAPATGYHDVTLTSGATSANNDFGIAPRPALTLTLIDPLADRPVGPLVHGATIDLADYPGSPGGIAVEATPAPGTRAADVGSVRFNFDGNPHYRIENDAPYVLGDEETGQHLLPWHVAPGTHTLVVTPYAYDDALGERGESQIVTFTVVNSRYDGPGRPVRVNVGGGPYTTTGGDAFAADSGFRGSIAGNIPSPIEGTDDDPLYASLRAGARMSYSRVVPNGFYTLKLHFAEPSRAPGQRVFDVLAEGARVLDDYDVAADAGRRTAVVKQFDLWVRDRRLDLSFLASRDVAIVSAIELLPRVPSSIAPSLVMLDAGAAAPFTDSAARVFGPDTAATRGFAGGSAVADLFDVENTTDDALYSTHRAGSAFTLRRPLANGRYALFLGFAEPDAAAAAGSRTFDVFAEGRPILDDFDVTRAAGAARTAVAKAFDVNVTDGAIDLTFRGVVGDAIVSSVILLPTDVPDAAKPYSLERLGETARQVTSASYLRQLINAVHLHANEWKGKYPADLKRLAPDYVDTLYPFASPRTNTRLPRGEVVGVEQTAWVEAHDDYVYIPGRTYRDGATIPVIYENPRKVAGPINVAFADGHVALLPREEAAALIGFNPAPPTDPATPPPSPSEPPYRPDPAALTSRDNLYAIGQALQVHANQNRGNLPFDLGRLFETQKQLTVNHFINPRDGWVAPAAGPTRAEQAEWVLRHSDYTYAGAGRNYSTPRDVAIAWENPADMKGGIHLLFSDGRVEFREMRWAVETIRRSLAWTRFR